MAPQSTRGREGGREGGRARKRAVQAVLTDSLLRQPETGRAGWDELLLKGQQQPPQRAAGEATLQTCPSAARLTDQAEQRGGLVTQP